MIIDSLKSLAVPIESLQGLPGNPRRGDVEAVAASLERFGQRKPIVVRKDDGTIIAGNHTWQAAKQLGWKEIAVAYVGDDDTTAQAYALADNRTAELGSYDEQALKDLIDLVAAVDPDLVRISGWSDDAVQELVDKIEAGQPKELNEDVVPEPAEASSSKPGDMWQLGEHRLLCGDALIADNYEKLMDGTKADLVWTDPPYGVAYVGKTKDALVIENDTLNIAELEVFLRTAFTEIFKNTRLGACWYVTAPSGNLFQAFSIPLSELDVWRHTLVWVKDTLVMGRADYHYRHESIFYGWTPGAAHQAPPDRKQDSVWEIDRPKVNKEHPTMKPIELITRSIENSTNIRDVVLDSFSGSGSTLIACEQTGRVARAMEIDPKYCDVIVKRWENLTGKKAVSINAKSA
jgi:site-specific DNA-methyltransferase (adenine-specific)